MDGIRSKVYVSKVTSSRQICTRRPSNKSYNKVTVYCHPQCKSGLPLRKTV